MNDPWVVLRRFTQARIGLGRCGSGLPTATLLEFFTDPDMRWAVQEAIGAFRLTNPFLIEALPPAPTNESARTRALRPLPDWARMVGVGYQCILRPLRQFDENKVGLWIKVILSRLVHDPQVSFLCRSNIRNDLIHFTYFQIIAVFICDAQRKSRLGNYFRHRR